MSDNQLIAQSLCMWANYIETGNPVLSRNDAANRKAKVNTLSGEQLIFVRRLRELSTKHLEADGEYRR